MSRDVLMKELTPAALKLAYTRDAPPYARGTALTIVGRVGGREQLAAVAPLLDDTTRISQFRWNNTENVTTELRDVALAVSVHLAGGAVRDYDFEVLKGNPEMLFTSAFYHGFADQAKRDAAFKKFRESPAKK